MMIPEIRSGPVSDALSQWETQLNSRYTEGFWAGMFTCTVAAITAGAIIGIAWLAFV